MGQEYPAQPVPAVAAVVVREEPAGRLSALLTRRANPPSQGEWSLPGGMLELGETLQVGVVREVLEETGILVEPLAVLEVLDHIIRDEAECNANELGQKEGRVRFHYVLIDFLCRADGGSVAAASDALEACWVSQNELNEAGAFGLSAKTLQVICKGFAMFVKTSHT